ncbi:carboxylic ester hydrolase [Favolaschia claudopus]|uniref:Carboxylic ester hydrolase n=1 Tax=Favolaschia claudopus TaxID=2862362 RepID=A0AAV9ZGS6_9AGAR
MAPAPLSLPAAELIQEVFSCVLYGIYLVTLGMAGRILLTTESGRWRRASEIRWVLVAVSVLLFVNTTLDLTMATITLMQAFILYTGPGGPTHVFEHSSGYQTITKSICVVVQSLTGDGFLIYRCWILYNRSKLVLGCGGILWFTNLACAARAIVLLTQASQGLILSSPIQPWMQSFWSLTIAINILATSLIVLRIWLVERENKRYRIGVESTQTHSPPPKSALSRAMRNIVESGMIYTVASILTLGAYTANSNLLYPFSAIELQSVGITFNLILIRGKTTTTQHQHSKRDHTLSTSVPFNFRNFHSRTTAETYTVRSGEGEGQDNVFALMEKEKDAGSKGGESTATVV